MVESILNTITPPSQTTMTSIVSSTSPIPVTPQDDQYYDCTEDNGGSTGDLKRRLDAAVLSGNYAMVAQLAEELEKLKEVDDVCATTLANPSPSPSVEPQHVTNSFSNEIHRPTIHNLPAFPNQHQAGDRVLDKFMEGSAYCMLVAQMQSGKTGTYLYVAHEMMSRGIVKQVLIMLRHAYG